MLLAFLAVLYVVLDYSIDFRPSGVYSSYEFQLDDLSEDQPVWLQQDNLTILLIKRSDKTIQSLLDGSRHRLQDEGSAGSSQPSFAANRLRSSDSRFFVSYGFGTHLGCPLVLKSSGLVGEVCSDAQYDFAGRAIASKNRFQNLSIPDYNFSEDYKTLTIRP